MQPHIDGVRTAIGQIISGIMENARAQLVDTLRFALVGYSDYGSQVRFEQFAFNSSIEEFRVFCSMLSVVNTGNFDIPEDVFGGLEKMLQLDWSAAAGTRVVFHFADAPCHGQQYHMSELGDRYPAGDPEGRTHEQLFAKIQERNIQVCLSDLREKQQVKQRTFAVLFWPYSSANRQNDLDV